MSGDYANWCKAKGVEHAHCPFKCEHPQPFTHEGQLYCGRCWFLERKVTVMIPCTPEVCK